MSAQPHRICRQVFEIGVRDAADAWPLQQALGRLQALHVEALLERCCTELGDPNRLHRIESLEIDLGRLDLGDFERDLLAKLGPALRQALAEQIGTSDERAARQGKDPEVASQLELLSLFARSGNLPWWAPTSKPHVVSDALGLLLERATPPLVGLVRALARQPAPLRRIVLNCDDDRLAALLGAMLAASHPALGESLSELRTLLRTPPSLAGATPSRLRAAIWVGALRAASNGAQDAAGSVGFWREALAQIALEANMTYQALTFGLEALARLENPGRPGALAGVLRGLARELQGEHAAAGRGELATPPEAAAPAEVAARPLRPRQGAPPEAGTREENERAAPAEPLANEGAAQTLPHPGLDEPRTSARPLAEPTERAPGRAEDDAVVPAARGQVVAELGLLLSQLAREGGELGGLFQGLALAVRATSAERQGALLDALSSLGRRASAHGLFASETVVSLLRVLRWVIEQRYLSTSALEHFLETTSQRATASSPGAERPLESAALREVRRLAEEAVTAGARRQAGGARATESDAAETRAPRAPWGDPAGGPAGHTRSSDPAKAPAGTPSGDSTAALAPSAPSRDAAALAEGARSRDTAEASAASLPARDAAQARVASPPSGGRAGGPAVGAPSDGAALARAAHALSADADETAEAGTHTGGAAGALPARTLPGDPASGSAVRTPRAGMVGASAMAARAMAPTAERPPPDLEYADADEAYVENAGLVVLWPLLAHLFERLGLMFERRFKDDAARRRAAGLLEHLATGEIEPVEYQLTLAKVLCGVDAAEAFEFGPPVTEREAEECTGLLRAAIASAPILGEMSIAGFRGSFLVRQGVLATRDGAFLLRVERAEYDIVLDRFPWGVSWVKLPWMAALLCVEW